MTVEPIPFARPDVTEREIEEVCDTLRSGWLTTGPKTKRFEAQFAERVGAKHAVALNSCTAALHLALEAIGLQAGDEVIVPTMTFASTAEVVRYFDAEPVLVDCLRADHQVDPERVAAAITSKTKAIIPVHFAGQACDLDPILDLASAQGCPVIEDAAHSFPIEYRGRPVGSIGRVTCFSFYATKTITTGEGGMATTDDPEIADRMRTMSLHGISKDAWKRYTAAGSWAYEIHEPGFKYNMTDVAASLGLVQLARADELTAKRTAIARRYVEALEGEEGVELLDVAAHSTHAWHLFVLRLSDDALTIGRDEFIEELRALGIGVSVHFIPLHVHPYYRRRYGHTDQTFPVAADCWRRSISLPLYSSLSEGEVTRVIEGVKSLLGRFRR